MTVDLVGITFLIGFLVVFSILIFWFIVGLIWTLGKELVRRVDGSC